MPRDVTNRPVEAVPQRRSNAVLTLMPLLSAAVVTPIRLMPEFT
jgi:hypothetical protein